MPSDGDAFLRFNRDGVKHVPHSDGEAKIWLSPEIQIATHTGLPAPVLQAALALAEAHSQEIRDAWTRHFGC